MSSALVRIGKGGWVNVEADCAENVCETISSGMQKESEVAMPKKRCPKCKELKERVNRVFSVISNWDEAEDDYRYDSEDLYNAELIDKCLECDIELGEAPDARRAEDNQAT